jgi:hypothetical protein
MALENPALNDRSFERGIEEADAEHRGMTAAGTYAITGVLLVIALAAAAFGWSQVEIVNVDGRQEALTPAWTWLVFLLTFVVAIVGAFAYKAAPITSVLYAIGEGSLLGIASRYYDLRDCLESRCAGRMARSLVARSAQKGAISHRSAGSRGHEMKPVRSFQTVSPRLSGNAYAQANRLTIRRVIAA